MKKFLFLLSVMLVFNTVANARDYMELGLKEAKHAQKYSTADKIFDASKNSNLSTINTQIKDPKLLCVDNSKKISDTEFKKKVQSDEAIYQTIKKNLDAKQTDNYSRQAYQRDFYKVYRVADKIIRANNLGYMNWRIVFLPAPTTFNAMSTETNCIIIYSALYDTLIENEDAFAFVVAHEMAHSILGHSVRTAKIARTLANKPTDAAEALVYAAAYKKYTIESKNMEYAADATAAMLIKKAGYDLDGATEVFGFIDTFGKSQREFNSTHPYAEKRIENFNQTRNYFLDDKFVNEGRRNICNSKPLTANYSSDRKSIVIGRNSANTSETSFRPETPKEICTRVAYKAYLNGEFEKSLKYFNKLFEMNKSNYAAYLYASYACEYLYKENGKKSYLNDAKNYAKFAQKLAPNDKNVSEQIEAL
ncbi:MAG: M48 family metallopeptidase [bacterium]|nr:M48 family metallopeptidase [bacterium]